MKMTFSHAKTTTLWQNITRATDVTSSRQDRIAYIIVIIKVK